MSLLHRECNFLIHCIFGMYNHDDIFTFLIWSSLVMAFSFVSIKVKQSYFFNATSFSKCYSERTDLKNELWIIANNIKFLSKYTSNIRDKHIFYVSLFSLRMFIMLCMSCIGLYIGSV